MVGRQRQHPLRHGLLQARPCPCLASCGWELAWGCDVAQLGDFVWPDGPLLQHLEAHHPHDHRCQESQTGVVRGHHGPRQPLHLQAAAAAAVMAAVVAAAVCVPAPAAVPAALAVRKQACAGVAWAQLLEVLHLARLPACPQPTGAGPEHACTQPPADVTGMYMRLMSPPLFLPSARPHCTIGGVCCLCRLLSGGPAVCTGSCRVPPQIQGRGLC